jgi:hypothetical protein
MVGASISVKASNSSVKRLPSRAQGTGICVTLPQPAQATRGTSVCRCASYWKKSRWRHERAKRSCSGCAARPTGRTGMNGGAKRHLEVDPSGLWLKGDLIYLPRSNKAQSLGEQRFNHEEPVARGKAAIVLHAEGGRLPPSARRKRKRGGGDVKGSATPGLRPPLTSPPPQTRNATARSTRNDIEPAVTK